MRIVTKKVYTFNELSPEAQERAIQDHIDNIDWSIESDFISEVFQDRLIDLGYPTKEVPFSLNNCQGDGVAFYGDVDVPVVAKRLLTNAEYDLLMSVMDEINLSYYITKNSFGYRYSHWNTMEVEMTLESYSDRLSFDGYEDEEVDVELSNKVENLARELEQLISDDIKSVSRELEKEGYDMIEGIQSEESVIEYLKESDVEFYENGSRFVG